MSAREALGRAWVALRPWVHGLGRAMARDPLYLAFYGWYFPTWRRR